LLVSQLLHLCDFCLSSLLINEELLTEVLNFVFVEETVVLHRRLQVLTLATMLDINLILNSASLNEFDLHGDLRVRHFQALQFSLEFKLQGNLLFPDGLNLLTRLSESLVRLEIHRPYQVLIVLLNALLVDLVLHH